MSLGEASQQREGRIQPATASAQPWVEDALRITSSRAQRGSFQDRVYGPHYSQRYSSDTFLRRPVNERSYPPSMEMTGRSPSHRTNPSLPSLSMGRSGSSPDSSPYTEGARLVYNTAVLSEDGEGALTRNVPETRNNRYPCSFYFLRCPYASDDLQEWYTHCLAHFRGCLPPRTVQCQYCSAFEYTSNDGHHSWDVRAQHIASHHNQGFTLIHARRDSSLIRHLRRQRIINDAEYQELLQGGQNGVLSAPPQGPYIVSQGRLAEERRRPDQQRRHHPGERRRRP
jgi:hypothetical protein